MGFTKPIEQIFIEFSRYIYVSKRYYTSRDDFDKDIILIKVSSALLTLTQKQNSRSG